MIEKMKALSAGGSVNTKNWLDAQNLRWSLFHTREIRPSVNVRRGNRPTKTLEYGSGSLDGFRLKVDQGKVDSISIEDVLVKTHTDAFLVMHKGKIVYERYLTEMPPHCPHSLASVAKSFVGIIVGCMMQAGVIKGEDMVKMYIPELAHSALADATIQQLLDMQVVCHYPVLFPDLGYIDNQLRLLLIAVGAQTPSPDYVGPLSIYDFLACTRKATEHGTQFLYSNAPTEALGWIIRKVSGKSLAGLLSEEIWSKLGAEEDAYYTVDAMGTEQASGGLHATLRDLARFGEMIRNHGTYNGQQIVPKEVVEEIFKGGNRELYDASDAAKSKPEYSYHNQWWINHGNRYRAIEAHGLFGQRIYIAPEVEMTIVQISSCSDRVEYTASFKLFNQLFAAIADDLN